MWSTTRTTSVTLGPTPTMLEPWLYMRTHLELIMRRLVFFPTYVSLPAVGAMFMRT